MVVSDRKRITLSFFVIYSREAARKFRLFVRKGKYAKTRISLIILRVCMEPLRQPIISISKGVLPSGGKRDKQIHVCVGCTINKSRSAINYYIYLQTDLLL